MGVRAEDVAAPFAPVNAPPPVPLQEEPSPIDSQSTEQDVLRRMQVDKLKRDAARFLQSRHMDSALESYAKILDLEPANDEAITAIADIHRASGVLTRVQMHYVKTAERVAPLGFRSLAVDLLDRAEAMFPGSTRLYRRTLGLLEVPAAQPPRLPESAPAIPLDLDRQWAERAIALPASVEATLPPPQQPEYEWAEFSDLLPVAEPEPAAELRTPPAELTEELTAILSDIDFQMDYGSPEEALIEIEKALSLHLDHPELRKRREQAQESLRRLGHEVPAEPLKESDFTPSFFDLSDMLGDALLESGDGEEMHDATNVVEKIRSVDELFNAFREGVEQQVKGDDYDTHYNLGIAYKEMMLLDPAIEEFKNAMRDPERTLECCSMLAICEQTQGNLDAAIHWLRKGIETPGFPPEDGIGLRYDLGNLLRAQDRQDEAREQFQRVYQQNPDYREVAKLI